MAIPSQITPYVRTISGKGSLSIPESFAKAVRIFLYVDVVRENKSVYRSYRKNPSESFFGYITANIGNYVLATYPIDYDRQVFELFRGSDALLMRAVKCLEKAVRNYVFLGTANPAVIFLDQLAEFEPNRYDADNFKFVCYGGTALRLELRGYEASDCGIDDSEPTPPPPPPQDEPFPQVPPDEPITVSPPEPGEEPETDPFEGDEEEPGEPGFPIGEECQVFEVTLRAIGSNSTTPPGDAIITLEVFGVIEDIRIEPEPGLPEFERLVVVCGGLSFTECMQGQSVSFAGAASGLLSFEIISILPVA